MKGESKDESNHSRLEIETAAVIGAGISGVVSAAHLLRAGIDVTVFERADGVGGAWIYNEQPDRDPPFPNERIQSRTPAGTASSDKLGHAERTNGAMPGLDDAAHAFGPPGPVYTSMKSRSDEVQMRTTLRDWPDGIKAPIDPRDVVAYLRDIAEAYHVRDKIHFRTRTSTLLHNYSLMGVSQERKAWNFDAVAVAVGRNSIPRVPDVPGLSQWKARFPSRIKHSKQYRSPEPYRNKTLLVVGAHVSALDITNHLVRGGVAKVYQSARPREIDFRGLVDGDSGTCTTVLEKVAMVAEFAALVDGVGVGITPLDDGSPIPAKVLLQDGRVLDGIHHVLFTTGYLASFPFLGPDLEQPYTEPQDADETVIVTADARTVHNLHEDILYIPGPSLAFIGISLYVSSFSMFDVQAQILAAVWAGRARLPSRAAMVEEQRRRKSLVQLLPGMTLDGVYLLDDFVMRRLLDWVNTDMAEAGGCRSQDILTGPDAKWWAAF
ncbi:dimethylaniline monooxygenase [Apiospora saccharicola]